MSTAVFYISKILRPILASPLFIALLLILIALIALKAKTIGQRATKILALVALGGITLFSEPFVATGLARLWEYPRTSLAEFSGRNSYAAIVLLGGSLDPVTSKPGAIEGNDSFERVVSTAELYRNKAASRIIVSGGSGSLAFPDAREAPYLAEFLKFMGVPASAIQIEDKSRNTYENAVYTKRLLVSDMSGAQQKSRVALVTSAWHMRRAAAIFRKAGIDFDSYSVDSLAQPLQMPTDLFPDAWALTRTTRILREMIGYIAYWMMGRL